MNINFCREQAFAEELISLLPIVYKTEQSY